jgi:hypothetical protein
LISVRLLFVFMATASSGEFLVSTKTEIQLDR